VRWINRVSPRSAGSAQRNATAKTRLAKSVLDAGWGMLKAQLKYKGEYAGRCVQIVTERNTTRTCSSCGSLTGPSGLDMLAVRVWMCSECGVTGWRREHRKADQCTWAAMRHLFDAAFG